jgi:hypothetical protein
VDTNEVGYGRANSQDHVLEDWAAVESVNKIQPDSPVQPKGHTQLDFAQQIRPPLHRRSAPGRNGETLPRRVLSLYGQAVPEEPLEHARKATRAIVHILPHALHGGCATCGNGSVRVRRG